MNAESSSKSTNINENERKIDSTISQPNLLKKTLKERSKGTLDSQFVSSRVPKEFINLVSCFYDSTDTIEELWKVVTVSTNKTLYDADTVLEMACHSFRQLINHVRKGNVKKSIYALYWGICNKRLDEMYFEDLFENGLVNIVAE